MPVDLPALAATIERAALRQPDAPRPEAAQRASIGPSNAAALGSLTPLARAAASSASPTRSQRGAARPQGYRSPHEASRMQLSSADAVRRVVQGIEALCPPSHNWDVKRRELRHRIRARPHADNAVLAPLLPCLACSGRPHFVHSNDSAIAYRSACPIDLPSCSKLCRRAPQGDAAAQCRRSRRRGQGLRQRGGRVDRGAAAGAAVAAAVPARGARTGSAARSAAEGAA
jgi:hypothetical protein